MFDANVAPAFIQSYYELYLNNPSRLEPMYTPSATFSHADVPPFAPGTAVNTAPNHVHGLDEIRTILKRIQEQANAASSATPRMKVCFSHVDAVPGSGQSILVLVGGYFLFRDGASRFVHHFTLQHTSVKNNFLIASDVLRVYPRSHAEVGGKAASDAVARINYQVPAQAANTQQARGAPHATTSGAAQSSPNNGPVKQAAAEAHTSGNAAASSNSTSGKSQEAAATSDESSAKSKSNKVTQPRSSGRPPVARDWSDLMDEAEDAVRESMQNTTPSAAPAKADAAAAAPAKSVPVSSYAAAVRKAASSEAAKPAQKIGGVAAAAPAPAAEESEAKAPAVARGAANRSNDDSTENRRAPAGRPAPGSAGDARPVEGARQFIKYNAILKNLPPNSTDEEIMNLLAPFVKVESVRNGTTNGRTFAFVRFEDVQQIPSIQEHGLSLNGTKVHIEEVVEKYSQQRRPHESNGPVFGSRRSGPNADGNENPFNRRPHMGSRGSAFANGNNGKEAASE